MDLRQLGYVVAIVDHGGFTRAADALHIAQPSLSQAVRTLEAELGAALFHRTGRTVVLTAAGEALLGPARQALRDADNARAAVAEVVGLAAGHLDVVCLPTLAVFPVAEVVGQFRRDHPLVTVRLAEPEDASSVADRVRTGISEVGFAELPLPADDLETHELASHDFLAVLPPGDATGGPRRPRRLSLRSLATMPLITTPVGTSMRHQIDGAFAAAGLTPNLAVETDHREVIVALVLAGAGAAILPRPVAESAAARGATVRDITPEIRRRVGLVHRRGRLSPAAEAFVRLVLAERTSAPSSGAPPSDEP